MNRAYSRLIAVCSVVLLTSIVGAAQDFSKKYELAAGGHINIHSVSGNVTITGYNGNVVLVTAIKEGRDRDRVEVEDLSSGDRIDLRSRYPEHCNCNASINFTVQVPRGVKYNFDKIGSASGDIEIRGVAGEINGRSASGDVTVEDVEGNIAAASASGNVRVKAPADLDAEVEMSCTSGDLKTDFALAVNEPEHGAHRSARGRLGSGSRVLKIRSSSGSVSLLRN